MWWRGQGCPVVVDGWVVVVVGGVVTGILVVVVGG